MRETRRATLFDSRVNIKLLAGETASMANPGPAVHGDMNTGKKVW